MRDVEKGKELSYSKGKGKEEGVWGKETRKTFITCWAGNEARRPFIAQGLDFGHQHKQGRG